MSGSRRLNFVLDGRDALSRVLDRVGDNANRLHRRVSSATTNMQSSFNRLTQSATRDGTALTRLFQRQGTAVTRYTTDANGRLRDLNGRFVSTSAATRGLTGNLGRLAPSLGDASDGAEDLAKSGGKLGPVLGGAGAALGLSLLPAIGAVAPMAAGAGLAVGTLKMGFAGVGEAAALAGEDKKEYAKALKNLSPEARSFTKELVKTKDQFSEFGEKIQAAMLPGFTKALKEAKPVVDIVGRGMTSMGKGFGDAAAGAGRLFRSGGFQQDLKTNLDLGRSFVREMTGGVGALGRSFLEFGAKSGPTLRSFSTGLSGLLGKGGGGLSGMFKGLEPGIAGSARLLDGLFGAINRILPALGRLGGEAGRTFGPLFGELFTFSGKATSALMDGLGTVVKWLSPAFKDLSFGVKSLTNVLSIVAPTVKDMASAIFGSFMPAFSEVDKARGPLQRLSDTINENKGRIQEFARQASSAMITVAGAVIENLPAALGIFRMVTGGMVTALGGVLSAAARTFGWIPGIGDKLKSADRNFAAFKDSYINGLKSAEAKTRQFATEALPKLEQGRLKMNINNWTSQIETAKNKLKTVPPSKQASLKAEISDLQRKVADARARLNGFNGASATAYINVQTRYTNPTPGPYAGKYVFPGKANGGLIRGFASGGSVGGRVRGPGTETSDSILTRLSNNEYVVRARSVAKYGVAFLDALNEGRLGLAATMGGAGGSMAGAGAEAGRGLSAGLRAAAAGVEGSARGMASALLGGITAELEIASPSKKTTKQGRQAGAGLAKGMRRSQAEIKAEAKRMATLAQATGKSLIAGLTGSKSQISSAVKSLTSKIRAAWQDRKTTKDDKLVSKLGSANTKLQKLATERDKIAAKIAEAKKYASSVTATARQDTSLESLGIEDGKVSAGSIKAGLEKKLAKLRQFTTYVNTLAKRGLSKTLLRQIFDMGPEQGYAYANALAGASASTIKSINSTQSALTSGTDKLGKTGADLLYDSGKNAAKGYLKGLDSQQKAIEAQMVKIAKSMDKAIRKALGIKSPSTVAAVSGGYFTEGLAVGAVEQIPVLDRAMGAVAGRMAAMRPTVGRPAITAGAGAAGGGGGVIHLNVTFTGLVTDPVATGKQIQKTLADYAMATGQPVKLGVSG
ncbi:hypothetical protein [Streptomyces bacillaris]|uniref:hypothetical protein n=1 Tax=Streptomyces bacillaris TaxID=68179 RepID=UPI003EBED411